MKRIIIIEFVIFTVVWGQTPCTVSKTKQVGECMFISNCPEVLKTFKESGEMPTICDRVLRTICCPLKTTTTSTTTTTTTHSPIRISVKKCKEYGQLVYEKKIVNSSIIGEPSVVKMISKCNHESVPLIVGGEDAKDGEFPHMALIGFGDGNRMEDYQCGGSMISEQWILSAAHCVSTGGLTANFAKVGNVVRGRDTLNSWTYKIIQRIPHPNYNSRFADDDIALFKLEKPAQLNVHVIPICLPDKELLTTKSAIASGYGRTGFADDVSEKLMKVIIEYFKPADCNEAFADNTKLSNNQINWDKMVCAGSHNKTGDTCNGDSGGPLQIYHSDVYCMYKIIGITSFGHAYCGFPGVPAIYTKVYHYLDWIESIVWPNQ
ncbi:hypothetical protein PVAND_005460 [Polypedilum vanderplanki]|uniref:Peptidase S1 domain-containing protein n=1 Tax=Polypedilum vanderplanki TaxID=319348 RepID=A0A9J6C250_POLVA|nr:hypothetical protein PVAND_005460 [Polypedilum vanderplanki]